MSKSLAVTRGFFNYFKQGWIILTNAPISCKIDKNNKMEGVELYYKNTEKLGHTFHKLYKKGMDSFLDKGIHICDVKEKDGSLFSGVKLKISVKTEGNDVRYVASMDIEGIGMQELSSQDLGRYLFDVKRKYSKIKRVRGVGKNEGVMVLCERETGKLVPALGSVASPGFMKNLTSLHPNKEIEISYKVEFSEKTKEWRLFVAERGMRNFAFVPDINYRNYEFCFL